MINLGYATCIGWFLGFVALIVLVVSI